jgi:hypothetical protein
MKSNLEKILSDLIKKRNSLQFKIRESTLKLERLKLEREKEANKKLVILLPNLNMDSISQINLYLPDFDVPVVNTFFFLNKKVDPNVSLSMLRNRLDIFLTNLFQKNENQQVPDMWRKNVLPLDKAIHQLEQKVLPSDNKIIQTLNNQIDNLQRIVSCDLECLPLETKRRLHEAFSFIPRIEESPYGTVHDQPEIWQIKQETYPSEIQIESNIGPYLLDSWLLHQISSPKSELLREVGKIQNIIMLRK